MVTGKLVALAFAVAAVLAAAQSAAADTRWQASTGVNYSSGKYDEAAETGVLVLPFAVRAAFGAWSVRASIPVVVVDGPADVREILDDHGGSSNSGSGSGSSSGGSGTSGGDNSGSGSGGSGSSGSGSGSDDDDDIPSFSDERSSSGLGDATLAATYSFDSLGGSNAYLDLTGRVRLPTGSESEGLSVGATDYHALAELGYDGDAGGVYASGGRRFLGAIDQYERVDGWQAGVGGWFNVGDSVVIGAHYDWRNASVRNGTDPSSLEGYVTWRLSDAWKVEVNGGVGLSDASADYSMGVMLIWRSAATR